MSIADAYSAMCIDRPYRKGRAWSDIRTELEQGAGVQFDPELVKLFIDAIEEVQRETPLTEQ
jgi:HD-GYP domain-containing protein (c-di-GMP phosphodiesterase class II)